MSNEEYVKIIQTSRKTYYRMLKADYLTPADYKKLMYAADLGIKLVAGPHRKYLRAVYDHFATAAWQHEWVR